MSDKLLTHNDIAEELSRAYVAVVAARAGYTTSTQNLDRDGVDVQIRAGGNIRPSLDIQLKATINLGEKTNGLYRYALKRHNYDLLISQTLVPRILVILSLPQNHDEWVNIADEELILRHCAFWVNLLGLSESQNKESVTISIDSKNRFDVESLKQLMEQARNGAIT